MARGVGGTGDGGTRAVVVGSDEVLSADASR